MSDWLSPFVDDGIDQANIDNARVFKPKDVGFFEGGLKATGEGIARGGVAVARAGQLAGSLIPLFQDELWGLDPTAEGSAYREYMDVTDPVLKAAEDAYQVDEDAGAGAQVLGGLGRIVLPLMAGGGNPTPLIASETTIGAQDALKQGATSEQAVGIGVAQGAVAGLGFKIPAAIGNNAATKVASGAAINVGLGAGLRGVQGTIAGDNEKLAEMYDPFDPTYVLTDLAIGATFGAIAAIAGKRRAAPLDQQDAIADAEIQQQTQASAPVTPDSPNVANRHAQNLDAAEQALNTGQPVNAKPIIRTQQPSADLEAMPVDDRKKLKYNSPQLDAYAALTEQKYGLPDGILNAIKNSGERSNSDQVSPAGAQGVMQFIPSTWATYGKGLDSTDPVHSIDAAGRFWADLIKQYDGNVLAAAAHYNGGTKQGKLVASGKRPSNAETAGYVDRIERHLGAMGKDVPMPPRVDEPIVTDGEPPLVQTTPDVPQPKPDLFGDQQSQADVQPIVQPDVAPPVRSTEQPSKVELTASNPTVIISPDSAPTRQQQTEVPQQAESSGMGGAKRAETPDEMYARLADFSNSELDFMYRRMQIEKTFGESYEDYPDSIVADFGLAKTEINDLVDYVRAQRNTPPYQVQKGEIGKLVDNGKTVPFATYKNADYQLRKSKLSHTHDVVEAGIGQFVIREKGVSGQIARPQTAEWSAADGRFEDLLTQRQMQAVSQKSASQSTPEQQAALNLPDDLRIPTGELDADGNPITMTAKEMREQLAAEKAAIDEQTKANDAAINCALQFGE